MKLNIRTNYMNFDIGISMHTFDKSSMRRLVISSLAISDSMSFTDQ